MIRPVTLVCILALGGCASAAVPNSQATTRIDSSAAFGWEPSAPGLEVGHLQVPVDEHDPTSGAFTLLVERHLARDPSRRIGSLLVNPGGPGYGGTELAESATQIYSKDLLDRFDIVAWDPRGTGRSEPHIDCIDDHDPYFAIDSSPDSAQEQQAMVDAATLFVAGCEQRSGAILPFVSTTDSARDMDAIRAALGETTISYFGFSYGSELGVTWATMFPATVRAMVIDGSTDQTETFLQQNLDQAAGFETTFNTFLDACAKTTICAFHGGGDPGAAFDELSRRADAEPVATHPGRPPITQGVLTTAVAQAMYSPTSWPRLQRALADLEHGDGNGVLALYDDYYERRADGTYDNALEAYYAINCLDHPGTADAAELFAMQPRFAAVAPRLGASWVQEMEFCAAWPMPAAKAVAVGVNARGAGPVVVIGTTGDPATPLADTRRQSDALEDGHLVVVTADQHTGYGVNTCVDRAVDQYLTDLVVPATGLVC